MLGEGVREGGREGVHRDAQTAGLGVQSPSAMPGNNARPTSIYAAEPVAPETGTSRAR